MRGTLRGTQPYDPHGYHRLDFGAALRPLLLAAIRGWVSMRGYYGAVLAVGRGRSRCVAHDAGWVDGKVGGEGGQG